VSTPVPVRILPASLGALLVTLAVFLFMQGLIAAGQQEAIPLAVFENVEILRPQPEQDETAETDQPQQEQPLEQPLLASLAAPAPPSASAAPQPQAEAPALDLAMGDISVGAVGDSWSAPLGQGEVGIGGGGMDARGFVEVVPYNTRKPNVPEVAWQNKISGWVLVAFTVTPDGRTRDVRVLDARPRGVFEEKVIAAVQDWQYTLSFRTREQSNLVLTQRVEVRWQDYPANLPNVD
jgi:TonB family protein